jgi:hypothetical protein
MVLNVLFDFAELHGVANIMVIRFLLSKRLAGAIE